MRRKIVARLVVLVVTWLFLGAAQAASLLPNRAVVTENQLPFKLGLYLYYFEDKSSVMSFDQVRTQVPESDWQLSHQEVPSFGVTSSAYWFHTFIDVSAYKNRSLMFLLDFPALDHANMIVVHQGKVIRNELLGDRYDNPEHTRAHVMEFNTQDMSEVELYIQLKNRTAMELPLMITTPVQALAYEQDRVFIEGIFNAILCLAFAFALYKSIIKHSQLFRGYALFFVGQILFIASLRGTGKVWFWNGFYEFNTQATALSAAIILIAMAVIGLEVTRTHQYRNVFRWVSYMLIIMSLFMAVYVFYDLDKFIIRLGFLLYALTPLYGFCLIGFAFKLARRGDRFWQLFVASWVLYISSLALVVVSKLGFLERTFLTEHLFQYGQMITAIVMMLSLMEKLRQSLLLADRYEAASNAKSEFLAKMSHDLRTPLNSILGFSQLLMRKRKEDPVFQKEAIETIHRNGKQLLALVNDLLDMEKIESGCLELRIETVSVTAVLNDLLPNFALASQEKGLTWDVDFGTNQSAELPSLVTDEKRLKQILNNLLSNAVKYTLKGGVQFAIKTVGSGDSAKVEFHVRDSGIGIGEQDQKRLFQRYLRSGDERIRHIEGTGLGLLITAELVRELGGDINYVSQLNQGSEFVVSLPFRHPSIEN